MTNPIPQPMHVLIDTDAGGDDALALMMMFEAHKRPEIRINIVGIICAYGNTTVKNVAMNVKRTMLTKDLTEKDIPIFEGCPVPILHPLSRKIPPYWGKDGFGDADLPPVEVTVEKKHGVTAIIDMAHKYKDDGKLTILQLGAMTNLAIALRMDPRIRKHIKELHVLGGNKDGEGNTTVSGEFNFVVDAEGAEIVLATLKCPLYLVPWEVCKSQATSIEWRLYVLGSLPTREVELLNKVEAKTNEGQTEWIPADQLAAAALILPAVVIGQEVHYCTVELNGRLTRGLMVVDRNKLLNRRENVTLYTEFERETFQKMLLWGAGATAFRPTEP